MKARDNRPAKGAAEQLLLKRVLVVPIRVEPRKIGSFVPMWGRGSFLFISNLRRVTND